MGRNRPEPPLPPPSNFATATYTRLVDLYTPYVLRSLPLPSIDIPDSPPPPYEPPTTITTPSVRARERTISDTDLRRSKRRHLSSTSSTPRPSHTPSSSRSTLRTRRSPAQSTFSPRPVNIPIPDIGHPNKDPDSPSLDEEITAMSFLNPSTNYLSANVDITYEHGGLVEMVGGPNTGSSYSLSGHVTLTVPILPRGAQTRQREVRDLTVTMESMQDYHDDHGRYTPFRLHKYTASLALDPLPIPSHDVLRPNDPKFLLSIPFDLRLPGWLPPTHISSQTKIDHGVTAKATIGWSILPSTPIPTLCPYPQPDGTELDNLSSSDGSLQRRPSAASRKARLDLYLFPNSSLSIRSTATSSSRHTPFNVIRHRLPAAITQSDRPNERQYTLKPEADPDSPVECVVLCPDWVDVNGPERSLKIALRLRAKHLPETISRASTPLSDCSSGSAGSTADVAMGGDAMESTGSRPALRARVKPEDAYTHVLELGMEVEEVERFSSTPITSWGQSFPVPPQQPNRAGTIHPLISPRSTYADIGVVMQNDSRPHRSATTRPCLLADDGSQRNFFFAGDGLSLADKWRKVNVVLPMPAVDSKQKNNRPQSELDSPFLRIRHNLKIKMVCRITGSDETKIIVLTTPIRFGTLPTTHPSSQLKSDSHLPAYIQLFHENGDLRECDPLPLYTKDEPDGDIIMSETPPETPTLPTSKPVSPGVAPLPPLSTRAASPPIPIEIPSAEDDYPMESDSSGSESDGDGESEASEGSGSVASASASGSSLGFASGVGSSSGESFLERELAREREHRAERERERQRERDRDRLRRMEVQRERERETRSQAPPHTPRTAGARKPARTPRTVRAVA